ncbi:AI-2E family transporter [Ottowia caeni]|uniref:AI-2E family transporter n=1 Tax=Ottowia caeni TaxID=2870339 RepID=UPI001E46E1E8
MTPQSQLREQIATVASHVAIAAALLLIMWQGLLPGLLCACLGFLGTRWFSPRFGAVLRSPNHQAPRLAATVVVLIPLIVIAALLPRARGIILDAPSTYRELLGFMASTVLELRDRLPQDIATQLPTGAVDVQRAIASYLASKAGTLATTGRAWLSGLLFAFVGLLIGALAAARPSLILLKPLSAQMHLRLSRFGETFRQIVVAQFWIALFNTTLTAVFLLIVLPLWDTRLPYSMALILLTFAAGLIPIVGNLICNAVLTLVGLSVSPWVALACLAFLIVIHKAEYFINAKVIGHRTHMSVWELLAVMFVMEAIFGPAGLVAAPLFYAYFKKELEATGWV